MPIERVVVDASALIVLFKAELGDILHQCFREVVVPVAVLAEVGAVGDDDPVARAVADADWLQSTEIHVPETISNWDLGRGESEVLSFALMNQEHRAVVDDAQARRCARVMSIATLGTGGVVVLAKNRGVLSSATDALDAVREAGLWISDDIVELLKEQAGES